MKAYSQKEWAFLFPKGSKRSRMIPAIVPIEDLKSAQKEGVSIYAMSYLSSKAETTATEDALCSMPYGNGAG